MSEVVPLPSFGEVFFDARGQERVLRVTWHEGTLVLSLWRGEMCTASFRMPMDDVGRLLDTLDVGYAEAGDEYAEGDGEGGYPEEVEDPEYAEYAEYPGTGQYARPAEATGGPGEYGHEEPYDDEQTSYGHGPYAQEETAVATIGPKDVLVARGAAPVADKLVASRARPADYAGPTVDLSDHQAQPVRSGHAPQPDFGPQSDLGPHSDFGPAPDFARQPDFGLPGDPLSRSGRSPHPDFAPRGEHSGPPLFPGPGEPSGHAPGFPPQASYPGQPGQQGVPGLPGQPARGQYAAPGGGYPELGHAAYADPALGLVPRQVPQQSSPLGQEAGLQAAAPGHSVNPDYTPPSGFSLADGPSGTGGSAGYGTRDDFAPAPDFTSQGRYGVPDGYGAPGEFAPGDSFAPRGDYGPGDAFGSAPSGHGRQVDPFAPADYGTPDLDYAAAPPGYGSSPEYPPLPEYGGASRHGGEHGGTVPRENLIVNDSLPFGQAPGGQPGQAYRAPGEAPGYEWAPQVPNQGQSAVDPSDPLGLGSLAPQPGDSSDPRLSRPYVHEQMYATGERVRPDGRQGDDGPPYSREPGREW